MCGLYLEGLKLEVVFCLQVDGPITPGGGGRSLKGGVRGIWQKKNEMFSHFFPQDDEELKTTIAAGSKSLLPVPVQELIKMIFDVESMKKTLVEFEVSFS